MRPRRFAVEIVGLIVRYWWREIASMRPRRFAVEISALPPASTLVNAALQ